jgi:alkyldihydroxyacetonephosphate synthase
MLREARGDQPDLPAAVFPGSSEEVATTLSWAASTGKPVVPRGAGSGACGAIQPGAGWIVLDLSRMDAVLDLDRRSGAVHVQAGIRGDRLEAALAAEGLTTGHPPVHQARRTSRDPRGEVVLLHQGHGETAGRGVQGDPAPG